MGTFYSLYDDLVRAGLKGEFADDKGNTAGIEDFDPFHLECLLKPEKQPPVLRLGPCKCDGRECEKTCLFEAVFRDKDGNVVIDKDKCTGCGECIENCKEGNLTDRKDIIPVLRALCDAKQPVYAIIAPAFISQFSADVTPGKLRAAFKKLGFAGMLEVALFADILTLKEALEFDRHVKTDSDFMLTSCCCPIWIAMIRKIYNELVPHLPPSVSPMAACGRAVKKLFPDCKTVFIGPCIAKKAEAKEKDISDAVDHVLTFKEIQQIFELSDIDPSEFVEDLRDHSSAAGRMYAVTGGVSEAVDRTVTRLKPDRHLNLRAQQANGAAECKKLLAEIRSGAITTNFIEGMGCVGGCVGGPKALIPKEDGTAHVREYCQQAQYQTPVDNPYVIELLHKLGFETVESLAQGENMFTRSFS